MPSQLLFTILIPCDNFDIGWFWSRKQGNCGQYQYGGELYLAPHRWGKTKPNYAQLETLYKQVLIFENNSCLQVCLFLVQANCNCQQRQTKSSSSKYGGEAGKLAILAFPCNQFGAQEPGTCEIISLETLWAHHHRNHRRCQHHHHHHYRQHHHRHHHHRNHHHHHQSTCHHHINWKWNPLCLQAAPLRSKRLQRLKEPPLTCLQRCRLCLAWTICVNFARKSAPPYPRGKVNCLIAFRICHTFSWIEIITWQFEHFHFLQLFPFELYTVQRRFSQFKV